MKLTWLGGDTRGGSVVEFALVAPIFIGLVIGVIECGLMLWTQLGLQHGVEMAARCASVNTSICGAASDVQNYAAQQSYGLNPSASTFTVSNPVCGTQVAATFAFQFVMSGFSPVTIRAQSCFPK